MMAPKPWMVVIRMRADQCRRREDEEMREGSRTEGGRDTDDQAIAFDFVEEVHSVARRMLDQIHIGESTTDGHPGWAGGVE